MQAMKSIICNAADAILDSSVLLCDGEVLEERRVVSGYPAIKDGARIILQKLPVVVSLQSEKAKFTVTMPRVSVYLMHLYFSHSNFSTGNRCTVSKPMGFFEDRRHTDQTGLR